MADSISKLKFTSTNDSFNSKFVSQNNIFKASISNNDSEFSSKFSEQNSTFKSSLSTKPISILEPATKTKLGGIKVGSNLTINNGVLSGTPNTTYNVATSSVNGLLSSNDKKKLDGIASGAQVNTVTSVAGKTGAVKLQKI